MRREHDFVPTLRETGYDQLCAAKTVLDGKGIFLIAHKRKYSISTHAMLAHLKKLNLQRGDVIVCRDTETLRYLSEVKVPGLDGIIPLVFAPEGIQKLNRQDLLNLLEQLEQQPTPSAASGEMPSAPL